MCDFDLSKGAAFQNVNNTNANVKHRSNIAQFGGALHKSHSSGVVLREHRRRGRGFMPNT